MRLQSGEDPALEELATALIAGSYGDFTYSGRKDVLSAWKDHTRNPGREVLTPNPDRSTRQGMYSRQANLEKPSLNARDGEAGMHRQTPHPLAAWMVEQGYSD